jgi:hypothetical protein
VEGRDSPAYEVLSAEGIPQLIRIFNATLPLIDEYDDVRDLLVTLEILALYRSREGSTRVIEAAQRPLSPDAYMWHRILSCYSSEHPHRDDLFEALSDPLPPGFLGIALLDSANSAAIKGELQRHPFDGPEGGKRLQEWLEDDNPDNFSYAHSATAALPFISNPSRDQLFALAMDHSDVGVQMEAAWAAAKLGREAGFKLLARYCLDVRYSEDARGYLAELDREDLIPAEASEPGFKAQANLASWLAHPNEMGSPPDEMEIVDHRYLRWPPKGEPEALWVIRYSYSTEEIDEDLELGCGLVGSMTWCFFDYEMHRRPPEDIYAMHCYWEMQFTDLIHELKESDAQKHTEMLGQWQGAPLLEPKITHVAELADELNAPAKMVALATARLDGAEGWVVLDGPRSAWYPKAEQPDLENNGIPLMIHVGRQLLGFEDPSDRCKYLARDGSE